MLHCTWRATRNMGKATYFYAFRFFLPTFFCCDAETTALHVLIITPISSHPLFVHTQLLSPGLHLDCKPQREAWSDTRAPLPLTGPGYKHLLCVFISQRYIIVIQVDKLPLILDFRKNLHHRFLIPKLRVPDDPFLSKDKKKINIEKVRKDQQDSPLVFCLPLHFLLDL